MNENLKDDEKLVKRQRITLMDSDEDETKPINEVVEKIESMEQPSVNTKKSKPSNSTKSNTETKKKIGKITEIDLENEAYVIINEMRNIYKQDLEDNRNGSPALRKLNNVDSLCSKIIRKEGQEIYLKMGILGELKVWLEPLPDNSLPNPKIKRTILDLLMIMRISKHNLLASGIGKIVHFYAKNERESIEIRKLAHSVMKKWKTRIVNEEILDY